jgi:hypothetical protein
MARKTNGRVITRPDGIVQILPYSQQRQAPATYWLREGPEVLYDEYAWDGWPFYPGCTKWDLLDGWIEGEP